jgi:catechol 2,3-dioxygenase-like lactoylglutathione lyase family enzyme
MRVLFVAGFGPIVPDREASRHFYGDDLGIRLDADESGYLHTEGLSGVKTFALWPLAQAAESCFGIPEWPQRIPVPQAWLEFDVDDLEAVTAELRAKGYALLVAARVEPWGQTVTRLLAPEGILVGITHTPSMRSPDMGTASSPGGPPTTPEGDGVRIGTLRSSRQERGSLT